MKTKAIDFIFKDLRQSGGSDEGARVYAVTTVRSGESEVVVEKTITKRMPIQDLEKALRMYEQLTGGGGRRLITIEDLVDLSWKQK